MKTRRLISGLALLFILSPFDASAKTPRHRRRAPEVATSTAAAAVVQAPPALPRLAMADRAVGAIGRLTSGVQERLAGRAFDGEGIRAGGVPDASGTGAAPAAPGDGAPGRAVRGSGSVVSVLRDIVTAGQLFAGLTGIQPTPAQAARFSEAAQSVYTTPYGSQKTSLAQFRLAAAARSQESFLSLRRFARGARGKDLPGSAGLLQEVDRLGRILDIESPLYQGDGRSRLVMQQDLALETLGKISSLMERMPSEAARSDLSALRYSQAELKALADLNRVMAEGVVRTSIQRPSAAEMRSSMRAAGWPMDFAERPIADVVVVGGGPAGLSAALHAAASGLRTALLEAGYVAQSFSDASMKSVYRMRTPAAKNSLVQEPFSPAPLVQELGMAGRLPLYRHAGQRADTLLYGYTGRPMRGGERLNLPEGDATVPSARDELMQHYAEIGEAIRRKGGFVVEQAPVESVRRHDRLWEVSTRSGHRLLAKKVVLAQGQVGVNAENGIMPKDLQTLAGGEGTFLLLRDRADLVQHASTLAGAPWAQLVLHDSLLGTPDVERQIALLPAGKSAAVIGSGESAAKSVVALLRINPALKVHLFIKEPFESAQVQVPPAHMTPDAIKQAVADPAQARKTFDEWEAFGSPVTPATLADIEDARAKGRVVVHALGKKCVLRMPGMPADSGTVDAEVLDAGMATQRVRIADGPQGTLAEIDGPIVSAIGYDRGRLRQDPLTTDLVAKGHLAYNGDGGRKFEKEFKLAPDGMTSAKSPDLYVIGSQSFGISADSAIPGGVARAVMTAEHIRKALTAGRAEPPAPVSR